MLQYLLTRIGRLPDHLSGVKARLPDQFEYRGYCGIFRGHPPVHFRQGYPGALFYFIGLQRHRAVVKAAIDRTVLHTRSGARRQAKQGFQRPGVVNPQFLTQFTLRTVKIIFTAIHVASSRAVPQPRVTVLAHRAFLEEEGLGTVKNQDMYGSMHKPQPVNL